jgi:hypothetical protein
MVGLDCLLRLLVFFCRPLPYVYYGARPRGRSIPKRDERRFVSIDWRGGFVIPDDSGKGDRVPASAGEGQASDWLTSLVESISIYRG